MMQALQITAPLLSAVGLDLEYRGHKVVSAASINFLFVFFVLHFIVENR